MNNPVSKQVSLHRGCPLIRGTDILEWGVGGAVGCFGYGYEKGGVNSRQGQLKRGPTVSISSKWTNVKDN